MLRERKQRNSFWHLCCELTQNSQLLPCYYYLLTDQATIAKHVSVNKACFKCVTHFYNKLHCS